MINEVFQLVNYITNKEGRGYIPPDKFNSCARAAQLEFLSIRLGNLKDLSPYGVPSFGYKSNRRVDADVRPFVYGPVQISIQPNGNFIYPYGFIYPDAFHKNDFSPITEIDSDQYPNLKRSTYKAPNAEYPVVIFRNPFGFVDPYNIGSFQMSYVRFPPNPIWGFTVVSGEPVFNEATSVEFTVPEINTNEIVASILEKVGVNLSKGDVYNYAQTKLQQGS